MLLFASDFDGTLCQRGVGVSEETRAQIKAFRESGNLFGVATGRDRSILSLLEKYDVEFDFAIILNGSIILDNKGEILFHKSAENHNNIIEKTQEIVESFGEELSVVFENERYDVSRLKKAGGMVHLSQFSHMNSSMKNDETANLAAKKIRELYGDILNPMPNCHCVDIPPFGIDKKIGILNYAKLNNIVQSDIYTAGDNYNDMIMLEDFFGFAVENAKPEVKRSAKRVVKDVGEALKIIREQRGTVFCEKGCNPR